MLKKIDVEGCRLNFVDLELDDDSEIWIYVYSGASLANNSTVRGVEEARGDEEVRNDKKSAVLFDCFQSYLCAHEQV